MPRAARKHWIGFDLGGTKMLAKVFDGKFRCVGEKRRRTKPEPGEDVGPARIIGTIRKALTDAAVTAGNLGGVGIGVPGPLDLRKGVLLESPNLGWKNMPLRRTAERALRCPVVLVNDVDAGVYGEYRFGAARGERCVLGVFPGTGVGGGCVHGGRLIQGRDRSCLEIGHSTVIPNGAWCGCGKRGCLETVASRLAIAAAAAAAAYRGDAPHLKALAGTDIAQIRSGVLAQSVKEGDRAVERIVRDAARWLGIGIANAVNLLAPDVIVLGGGLVEAMPTLYREEVGRALDEHVLRALADSYRLAVAELGDDAVAMGAAALAMDAAGFHAETRNGRRGVEPVGRRKLSCRTTGQR